MTRRIRFPALALASALGLAAIGGAAHAEGVFAQLYALSLIHI